MPIFALTIAVTLAVIVYIVYETYYVRVSCHRLSPEKGFSIVQLSDLHGRTRYLNGTLSRKVNDLNPDYLIITGDLATKKKHLNRVYDELAKIHCPNKLFILGNYERQTVNGIRKRQYSSEEHEEIVRAMQKLGMTVLMNDYIEREFNSRKIIIYGFDNSVYGNERWPSNIDLHHHDLVVLLAHSPRISSIIEEHNLSYNLLLTGHTHGGQIRLFHRTIGPYKDYHAGMRIMGQGRHFYINRGLGTVKLPIRLFCPPEIAVFIV